jgi:APA family basic amino acid/polyamine antiporter
MGLWSTKRIATLQGDQSTAGGALGFKRALGAFDLTALGTGAMIGAGIFVLAGTAAAQLAGPAVALSFVIAGLGCVFVGLCYAELASMIPAVGSAYTYSYAAFGELLAWVVGWNLILEYLFGAATVAVSWSAYFVAFLADWGVRLPLSLTQAPLAAELGWQIRRVPGATLNVPAMLMVLVVTAILVLGIRASANLNNVIVVAKVAIVIAIIGFGFAYVSMSNWHPFIPPSEGTFGRFGWSGVVRGAGAVFFSFIGFDTVSTAAQEARNPQRDLPIGILASIAISTTLYVLIALVMTGLVPYRDLNAPHPVYVAVAAAGPGLHWLTYLVSVATVAGLASVVLILLMGQSRILFAMARDGLMPSALGKMHSRFKTPYVTTIISGVCAAALAAFFPFGLLLDVVNVGALLAFVAVCCSILVLRYRQPNVMRPFRAPWVPVVPVIGALFSVGMLASLPTETWSRFAVWVAVGLVIYFLYGARKSVMSRRTAVGVE